MADETFDLSHTHTVIFDLADGEHITSLSIASGDDKKALFWAKKMHPKDSVTSVKRTTAEQHAKLTAELVARNKDRTPLDEKTGGFMNRALESPELTEAE